MVSENGRTDPSASNALAIPGCRLLAPHHSELIPIPDIMYGMHMYGDTLNQHSKYWFGAGGVVPSGKSHGE